MTLLWARRMTRPPAHEWGKPFRWRVRWLSELVKTGRKLLWARSINIATQPFAKSRGGSLAFGAGDTHSQWKSPGQGYIGFECNTGAGAQYGWVGITTKGTAGDNVFTINSHACGDVGDVVLAGEVPEPGSLALLAVGGAGILAWRKRRTLASRKPVLPA